MDEQLTVYVSVGILMSIFYGIFAPDIFWSEQQRKDNKKDYGRVGQFHQFWLNFVGSATGWYSLYVFGILQKINAENITGSHILLLVIGVLGIVGLLPATLVGVINSLAEAIKRLIDKIT